MQVSATGRGSRFALAAVHTASLVNDGGGVDREYGPGSGRTDLLVRKPCTDADGNRQVQLEVFELKVRRQREGNPLNAALSQIDGYLGQLGLDRGTVATSTAAILLTA